MFNYFFYFYFLPSISYFIWLKHLLASPKWRLDRRTHKWIEWIVICVRATWSIQSFFLSFFTSCHALARWNWCCWWKWLARVKGVLGSKSMHEYAYKTKSIFNSISTLVPVCVCVSCTQQPVRAAICIIEKKKKTIFSFLIFAEPINGFFRSNCTANYLFIISIQSIVFLLNYVFISFFFFWFQSRCSFHFYNVNGTKSLWWRAVLSLWTDFSLTQHKL